MEKLTARQRQQKAEMIQLMVDWETEVNGVPVAAADLETWEFDKIKAVAGGMVLHELERVQRRLARRRMN